MSRDRTMAKYGVTWATVDHSVAQTGYVFGTVREAKRAARQGPARTSATVEHMCEHAFHNGPLYGMVQTPDDSIVEVKVRG